MKRIHYFQHVPFEGLGNIEDWIVGRSYSLSATHFYRNEPLPQLAEVDWLIVMGGPMGTGDESQFPWLSEEKKFIERAIAQGKTVLGICLGAQLIAAALGARVYPNRHKEIGWFPVQLTEAGQQSTFFANNAAEFMVFHWHGDTFELPAGAQDLASTAACPNQAFCYGERVLGLQFHMDFTPTGIETIIENCRPELVEAPFIQSAATMLAGLDRCSAIKLKMHRILDHMGHIRRATAPPSESVPQAH